MKEILVTGTEQPLSDGRVPFGSCMFGSRHGDYETYEVLLSAKASEHVSPGDTLKWWRGASEWCYVDCFGEIIKADGSRIQLRGGMDIGIDTGHPPHLILKYKEVWQPQWVRRDYDAKWDIIRHDESGQIWFKPKRLHFGYGDLKLKHLEGATPLDYKKLPPLNEGERYGEHYYYHCYGWSSGWVETQVRRVVKTKTDELLIVQPA